VDRLASKITAQALDQMARSEKEVRQCLIHGDYTSLLIRGEWSGCVECAKAAELAAINAANGEWRKELKARMWAKKLQRAAIPEKFADRTLDSYVPTIPGEEKALAMARRYVESFDEVSKLGSCLLFLGKVGTGKTHLAIGIAHEVMAMGKQAVFVRVKRAVEMVQETYGRSATQTKEQVLRDFIDADLLILDEGGYQRGTDDEKLILFDIINGRYENSRPTIITSNLDAPGLKDAIGERSFDRLREGGGKLVQFDWDSHRARKS
jgi:DNA replication protein DnaC